MIFDKYITDDWFPQTANQMLSTIDTKTATSVQIQGIECMLSICIIGLYYSLDSVILQEMEKTGGFRESRSSELPPHGTCDSEESKAS
jgi:hypothetical protein